MDVGGYIYRLLGVILGFVFGDIWGVQAIRPTPAPKSSPRPNRGTKLACANEIVCYTYHVISSAFNMPAPPCYCALMMNDKTIMLLAVAKAVVILVARGA